MANLIIEMPEDLARSLQEIAAAQNKSVQEFAIEGLRSLVDFSPERDGSSAALLRVMREPPHPPASDLDEFDAILAAGRMPIRTREVFPD